MMNLIDGIVSDVSGFLYNPWVPLFLIVAGVFFTVATGFVQIRMLGESIRVVREKPKNEGAVSSLVR